MSNGRERSKVCPALVWEKLKTSHLDISLQRFPSSVEGSICMSLAAYSKM